MASERKDRDDSEGRSRRPTWVEIGGLAVAIAVAIAGFLALKDGDSSEPSPANLELVDLTVSDVGKGPQAPGYLEVIVHNRGGELVVVDKARIEIAKVYDLPRCATQGEIGLSGTYGATLPFDAEPGEVVETQLHQQIAPDEADRFRVLLSTNRPDDEAIVYVFEIRVVLLTDAPDERVPLGRMLVALPERPFPGEYYWDSRTAKLVETYTDASGKTAKELWAEALPCWRSNTVILRRALGRPGARSPDLDVIAADLVTPTFAALD